MNPKDQVEPATENGRKPEQGSPWRPRRRRTARRTMDVDDAGVAAGMADAHALIWSEFPAWLRQGSEGQELALSRLMADAVAVYEREAATVRDVVAARALGASWQHVGMALGISAEGARSRYGRPAGRRPGEEAASS